MKPCYANNGAAIGYLCWKSCDRAQCFVLMFTLPFNIVTGKFLLVSCSNTFEMYCGLYTVKTKNANKNIKRKLLSGFITIMKNH